MIGLPYEDSSASLLPRAAIAGHARDQLREGSASNSRIET